jgi:hypothetical protein
MGLNLKPKMFTAKPDKDGVKRPATSLEHLEMFSDVPEAKEFIALVKEDGSVMKTYNTYVVGFLEHLRSDGRMHPTYWLFVGNKEEGEGGAITGRLSCKAPAFQTIWWQEMCVMSIGHRTQKYTSPTYYSWTAMKNRCHSPTSKDWLNYGGRGIKVCIRWWTFLNFLKDMGEKPSQGWSIERKDVNGPYTKDNCVWALPKQQMNNRRNTKLITHNGVTKTEAQWALDAGISRGRLHYRLGLGLPMEEALKMEKRPTGRASKEVMIVSISPVGEAT